MSVCPSVRLSVGLSVGLSFCLSVCLQPFTIVLEHSRIFRKIPEQQLSSLCTRGHSERMLTAGPIPPKGFPGLLAIGGHTPAELFTHLQPNHLEVEVLGSGYEAVVPPKVEHLMNIGQKVAWHIGPCVQEIVFLH